MFTVVETKECIKNNMVNDNKHHVYLIPTYWDDNFLFRTEYIMYIESEGRLNEIGMVKIGKIPAVYNSETKEEILEFENYEKLDSNYFSLGQSIEYYEKIKKLGDECRERILKGMNDMAYSLEIYKKYHDQSIVSKSLMRFVRKTTLFGDFHLLATGKSQLMAKELTFMYESEELKFNYDPKSIIPTNMHAIIGRNGVGKTLFLKKLIESILKETRNIKLTSKSKSISELKINKVIYCSFSAFDNSIDILQEKEKLEYIGLSKVEKSLLKNKDSKELESEINESLKEIKKSSFKTEMLNFSLQELKIDKTFDRLKFLDNLTGEHNEINQEITSLSSGHKIVLLMVTKLVELLQEDVLVIMDEPELHLHPPLISGFTRAISNLLISQNAIAIIATHTPVIVQELPSECVYIYERNEQNHIFLRPEIETFGENIGTLTREIFKLEALTTGYYSILKKLSMEKEPLSIEQLSLGKEATYLYRYLLNRNKDDSGYGD